MGARAPCAAARGFGGLDAGDFAPVEAPDQGIRDLGNPAFAQVHDGLAFEYPHAAVELIHADVGALFVLVDVLQGEFMVGVEAEFEHARTEVAAGGLGEGMVGAGRGGEDSRGGEQVQKGSCA